MISHDDLIDRVWGPKRVITPDNLCQRMKTLRQSLGDNPNQPMYIEGVRGQGCRLVPEVKIQSAQTSSRSSRQALSPRLLVSLFVLALALGYIAFDKFVLGPVENEQLAELSRQKGHTAARIESDDDNSIAVLPFDNRSSREEDQFFTDGIHDDLLAAIARIDSMQVISRTSVMEYRNTVKKIPQIAQELGVANILEGGIQRSGNQVRINVQLIDAASDEHGWAEIYDLELTAGNLFKLGRLDDALEQALITFQLDPLHPATNALLGWIYFYLNDTSNALKHGAAAWDLGHGSGLYFQAWMNLRIGEFDRAVGFAEQWDERATEELDDLQIPVSPGYSIVLKLLTISFAG